jgi:DNA replication and repair protein RecF
MKITELTLKRFRNLTFLKMFPDPQLNFISGQNGQGKTSILEAIDLLATLRSFRSTKSLDFIQHNETQSEITVNLSLTDPTQIQWQSQLKLIFYRPDLLQPKILRTALADGNTFKTSSAYLSKRFASKAVGFHTIVFNPTDHELIRGEPRLRRNYLDRVIAAEHSEYITYFKRYQRVLIQRNALLKQPSSRSSELFNELTRQLAFTGARIALNRLQWVERLNQRLSPMLACIAPSQGHLEAVYQASWMQFTGQKPIPSLEELDREFLVRAAKVREREWAMGTTAVGPHRDDFTLLCRNRDLKAYGSQGEIRSALLALKLCEIELYQNASGHHPVFLLDDFSSELDKSRRLFLLDFLKETDLQVFVTSTEEAFFEKGKKFVVSEGNIHEQTFYSSPQNQSKNQS